MLSRALRRTDYSQGWFFSTDEDVWNEYAWRDGGGTWHPFAPSGHGPLAYRLLYPLPHQVSIDVGDAVAWQAGPGPFEAEGGLEIDFTDDIPGMNGILDESSGGTCSDTDGHDFIPFQFHSSTVGTLVVDTINFLVRAASVSAADPDSDGDGLTDGWEDTTAWTVRRDLNSDGDTGDPDEVAPGIIRSRPWLADSDGDGLSDDVEWSEGMDSTNPRAVDTDEDALGDAEEVNSEILALTYVRTVLIAANTCDNVFTVTHGGTVDTLDFGSPSPDSCAAGLGILRRYGPSTSGPISGRDEDWVIHASGGQGADEADWTFVDVWAGRRATRGSLRIVEKMHRQDAVLLTWTTVAVSFRAYSQPDPLVRDTDGDGLMDGWEVHGADTDGDGTVNVPLNAYGANPVMRDLFVEVDYLSAPDHSHSLLRDERARVEAAFARQGISLHIDTGELGGGEAIPFHTDRVMVGADPNHPRYLRPQDFRDGEEPLPTGEDRDGDGLLQPPRFVPHRDGLFAHALFVHRLWVLDDKGNADPADDEWRDDKTLGLGGGPHLEVADDLSRATYKQSFVFMTELGHVLGLCHSDEVYPPPSDCVYDPSLHTVMKKAVDLSQPIDYAIVEWEVIKLAPF